MKELYESRILIVDDTRANVDILVAGLKDHYQLSIALDGETALRRVQSNPPDLILLDIMMPGLDGYEVCRRLKADPATRDIPVMFLSALDEAHKKAAGFEAGGSDYVTKPFDLIEVRARVESLLKAKAFNDLMAAQAHTMQRSFSRFVPKQVVESLVASGEEAAQAAERRVITVSLSDIDGFTSISEHREPEELLAQLSEYLEALSSDILEAGGTVDKYIGDGILALWGAPALLADHAVAACRAMLSNQDSSRALNERWQSEGKPPFHTRIGISTGEAFVGVVGSRARLAYTALGDTVNVASRLEALNKEYGTRILISEATYRAAESEIVARPLAQVEIRGHTEPATIYELLAMRAGAPEALVRRAAVCTQAVDAFLRKAWDEAQQLIEQALRLCPDDRPSVLLRERCRQAREGGHE
jgi:adenylate cyclase